MCSSAHTSAQLSPALLCRRSGTVWSLQRVLYMVCTGQVTAWFEIKRSFCCFPRQLGKWTCYYKYSFSLEQSAFCFHFFFSCSWTAVSGTELLPQQSTHTLRLVAGSWWWHEAKTLKQQFPADVDQSAELNEDWERMETHGKGGGRHAGGEEEPHPSTTLIPSDSSKSKLSPSSSWRQSRATPLRSATPIQPFRNLR